MRIMRSMERRRNGKQQNLRKGIARSAGGWLRQSGQDQDVPEGFCRTEIVIGGFFMEEKTFKTLNGTGALNIVLGVIGIVAGVAGGVLLIISGSKLLSRKSKMLF